MCAILNRFRRELADDQPTGGTSPLAGRYALRVSRIPWSALSAKLYEDMVSVLLSHQHPTSTRVDGSGGDGGRDVQIATPDGIRAFELKSFPGRMTRARRTQVKKSLLKAKELRPIDWTLFVPIDFTPEESIWFDGLRKLVPFPIDRKGLTWLDGQFAARPFIGRYFLEDAANEIVRLAEILNHEKTILAGGAPDALERAGAIVDQLNGLNPFYRFEITVGEGVRSIKVIPRYKGAEIDSPIGGKFTFRFPNDEAGRAAAEDFQRAIDFGTTARVPAEYIEEATFDAPGQLGGKSEPTSIEIGPAAVEATTRTFILVCSSPDGGRIVELPLDFELESHGERGAIWKGKDRTGTLSMVLTADRLDRMFNVKMNLRAVESYYPQDMWPVARFLAALVAPSRFALHAETGERITDLTDVETEPWMEPWMPPFMEDLVLVQTAVRKVPATINVAEMNAIGAAAALLRGEEVEGTWEQLTTTISAKASEADRSKLFADEIPVTLITHDSHKVMYAGVEYRVGKRVRLRYDSVRLGGVARRVDGEVEIGPVPDEWAGVIPGGTEVVLVPGSTNAGHLSLVSEIGDADEGHATAAD
jgi:hypothetical protein